MGADTQDPPEPSCRMMRPAGLHLGEMLRRTTGPPAKNHRHMSMPSVHYQSHSSQWRAEVSVQCWQWYLTCLTLPVKQQQSPTMHCKHLQQLDLFQMDQGLATRVVATDRQCQQVLFSGHCWITEQQRVPVNIPHAPCRLSAEASPIRWHCLVTEPSVISRLN